MIEATIDPRHLSRRWSIFKQRRPAKVIAIFAFRYDVALVPALIENIRPFVDGWVCLDDRQSAKPYSTDRERRLPLIEAAMQHGADWILAVDPDERFEARLAERMADLTATEEPTAWGFHLRELYSPSSYRTDGIWGRKVQHRLFKVPAGSGFNAADFAIGELHATWFPKGSRLRQSGLNLYHLKMIDPTRRVLRRDLYKTLDPASQYQAIGYDYLADELGATFTTIARGRSYDPPHRDDGGKWMAIPERIMRPSA